MARQHFGRRLAGAVAIAALAAASLAGPQRAALAGTQDKITFLGASQSKVVGISFFDGSGTKSYSGVYAGYYHILVNGQPSPNGIGAFCTDVFDDIFAGETWTADRGETSDNLTGLPSLTYKVGPKNVFAVDYIAQHYSQPPAVGEQSAAQIAIWDLVLGGNVTRSGDGSSGSPYTYAWSSLFQVTNWYGANVTDSMAAVYGIEKLALAANGPSGSIFERAIAGTQSGNDGRPQDLAYASLPEPAFVQLALMLGLGGGVLLMGRRRAAPPRGSAAS